METNMTVTLFNAYVDPDQRLEVFHPTVLDVHYHEGRGSSLGSGGTVENAIDEFGTYEYDKKSIERGKEEPVKVDDHAMDAIRYLVMGMWKHLKHWLPEAEDEEE